MEDRWLAVDEIVIHLGVTRDTIYKWISKKELPAHKIGRLWKFKKEEVDDWVRKGGARDSK
jgi:excisionase family DNA binding protein